jgi:hypothetical protein
MTALTDNAAVPALSQGTSLKAQTPSRFSSTVQVVMMALLMLGIVIGYGRWRTGSLDLVWPWIVGQQLLFSPSNINLGAVPANQIIEKQIRVLNVSSAPLSLLGSQKTCNCIGLDEFPIEIAPEQTFVLRIRIRTEVKHGDFSHSIKIFCEGQAGSYLRVTINGSVQ